jgi:hypothetical protein
MKSLSITNNHDGTWTLKFGMREVLRSSDFDFLLEIYNCQFPTGSKPVEEDK